MKPRHLLVCIACSLGLAVGCSHQGETHASARAGDAGPDAAFPSWASPPTAGERAPVSDAAIPPLPVGPTAPGMTDPRSPVPAAGSGAEPTQDAAVTETSAAEPSIGAAIALSADDAFAVVVNRDVDSISILTLAFDGEVPTALTMLKEVPLGPGSEPYQLVLSPDGRNAYVLLRRDQAVVKVESLSDRPSVVGRANVGSEPTGIALDAAGRKAFVANWNDGTLTVIDTQAMKVLRTVDLNAALVATGYLGGVQARPALAHPRSIAIGDSALYVTEYFAQQREPEEASGANADTHKVGLVYKVSLPDYVVSTIPLAAMDDVGFRDDTGKAAGCYPNQLQSIAIRGGFAYVLSVCASPEGPLGVKQTTQACQAASDCSGLIDAACVTPFSGAKGNVCIDVASVKTTTAPVVSIFDTRTGRELPSGPQNLNARFDALYKMRQTDPAKQRFPLFASQIGFVPQATVGYVSANGSDAVFRFQTTSDTGEIQLVGATTNDFIDLAPAGIASDKAGLNPIGFAIGQKHKKLALVANEVSRSVSVLDFNTQALAGGTSRPLVARTTSLPSAGSKAEQILRGKRFFNTGVGRWSLRGQGWGACQSCHADGLTDNVTWYFARGPRQSTSLDGSFASTHPEDQRIFNWTAIADEVADFELNTRGVSGGVGAIVSESSSPPSAADRIDFQGLGQAGLNGSASQAADPANPLQLAKRPALADWSDIEKYMQSIRSPRAPTNLDQALVEHGRELFTAQGNCQGCHGGEKWTVSRRFYVPSTTTNKALSTAALAMSSDFPVALLPARSAPNQTLRLVTSNPAALDQMLCVLRPVGTFGVAESGVGIAELRADMSSPAQGDGEPAGEGRGYNVPSLLDVSAGAPYFHAGNARTLEAVFSSSFEPHHQALSANFLTEADAGARASEVAALVQYLLSIDEQAPFAGLPGTGASGGTLCPQSF